VRAMVEVTLPWGVAYMPPGALSLAAPSPSDVPTATASHGGSHAALVKRDSFDLIAAGTSVLGGSGSASDGDLHGLPGSNSGSNSGISGGGGGGALSLPPSADSAFEKRPRHVVAVGAGGRGPSETVSFATHPALRALLSLCAEPYVAAHAAACEAQPTWRASGARSLPVSPPRPAAAARSDSSGSVDSLNERHSDGSGGAVSVSMSFFPSFTFSLNLFRATPSPSPAAIEAEAAAATPAPAPVVAAVVATSGKDEADAGAPAAAVATVTVRARETTAPAHDAAAAAVATRPTSAALAPAAQASASAAAGGDRGDAGTPSPTTVQHVYPTPPWAAAQGPPPVIVTVAADKGRTADSAQPAAGAGAGGVTVVLKKPHRDTSF